MHKTIFLLISFLAINFSAYATGLNDSLSIDNPKKYTLDLGLQFGSTWINGDVLFLLPGRNINLVSRFLIKPGFGFKVGINSAVAFGLDWQPSTGHFVEDSRNNALTGGVVYDKYNTEFGTPDYRETAFYYNHKTQISSFYIGPLYEFHLGKKLNFNVSVTAGFLNYKTKMDALDANGDIYDFSGNTGSSSADSYNFLFELLDGTFESKAEHHYEEKANKNGATNRFIWQWSAGFSYNLDKKSKWQISLDYQNTITRDDLLDGQRYTEWGALSRDFDRINWLKIGATYKLVGDNKFTRHKNYRTVKIRVYD